jgi:hypothetical protein
MSCLKVKQIYLTVKNSVEIDFILWQLRLRDVLIY